MKTACSLPPSKYLVLLCLPLWVPSYFVGYIVKANQDFSTTLTYITCMTVYSTKPPFHQLLPRPGRWSQGRSGTHAPGSRRAVPSLPTSVRFECSRGQWCHLWNRKPRRALKGRSSSSARRRSGASRASAAVLRSPLRSTGGWFCPRSKWPRGKRRRHSS